MASRTRARVACQSCNLRKVRCDVTKTGIPCSNCQHETGSCQVLPRKKHRPRRTRVLTQKLSGNECGLPNGAEDSVGEERTIPMYPVHQTQCDRGPLMNGYNLATSPPNQATTSVTHPSSFSLREDSLYVVDSRLRGGASNPEADGILPDDSAFSYIGDQRGPRSSVYDLCHPGAPQEAQPYLPPRSDTGSWKPYEMDFLCQEGAFEPLANDICEDLIRCYFHHVHFFLPVVDASSFLNEYCSHGARNINQLLFWSMLLAATNFVDQDASEKAGFSSRKSMKTVLYRRAKCLYDLDRGTDKPILIQAVILMGFWYTDQQDHTGAWYWIGIAIILSQSLGLHRSPQFIGRGPLPSEAQQRLRRRLWWSCLVRDRWVSLAKGRPMRIHDEDCDLPMPSADDILHELSAVSPQAREKYMPADYEMLATMWIRLVRISDNLGLILRAHYRVKGPKASPDEIDRHADQLEACAQKNPPSDDRKSVSLIYAYHLELFYQATVAVLYRPYLLGSSSSSHTNTQAQWVNTAVSRARAAASATNSLLEKIIVLNAINLLKPMVITALVPAMQIHLSDCKSPNALVSGLGKNKLDLCMLVLSNLRNTYWSAGVMFRLFERAQFLLSGNADSALTKANRKRHIRSPNRQSVTPINQNVPEARQQQHTNDDPVLPVPEVNLSMNNQTMQFLSVESPGFSTVDQLLSPGFTVYDNAYQNFFTSCDADTMVPIPNEISVDYLYNI